jgi:transcriptional regulator with XRE-family HTH domain
MKDLQTATFGNLLKKLRTERRISQQKLAEAAGVERNYVYYLEKGTSEPTLGVLMGLASGLGLSFAEFSAMIEDATRNANNI